MNRLLMVLVLMAGVLASEASISDELKVEDVRVAQVMMEQERVVLSTDKGPFSSPEGMDLRDKNSLKEYALMLQKSGEIVSIRYREAIVGAETRRYIVDLHSKAQGMYLVDAESAAMEGVTDIQEPAGDLVYGEDQGLLPGTVLVNDVRVNAVNREHGMILLATSEGDVLVDTAGDETLLLAVEEMATLAMLQGEVLTIEMEVMAGYQEGAQYLARKVSNENLSEVVLPAGM